MLYAEDHCVLRWPYYFHLVVGTIVLATGTIGPDQTLLPDGVTIVYDGGVLSPKDMRDIVLPNGELSRFEFLTADEAAERVTPLLARRIAACLEACAAGTVAMLENGSPVA